MLPSPDAPRAATRAIAHLGRSGIVIRPGPVQALPGCARWRHPCVPTTGVLEVGHLPDARSDVPANRPGRTADVDDGRQRLGCGRLPSPVRGEAVDNGGAVERSIRRAIGASVRRLLVCPVDSGDADRASLDEPVRGVFDTVVPERVAIDPRHP